MSDVGSRDRRPAGQESPREVALANLATRQHGVVARWQLSRLGFTRDEIDGRLARSSLHGIYRGVYSVGHRRLSVRGRWIAAVLACGPNAVLSHRAAVALWDLRPIPGGAIDVTVPERGRRGQRGIQAHRVRRLDALDRAVVDGIPVTSVHRALLDYAEFNRNRPQQTMLALEAAERRDLLDGRALNQLIARSPGRHGLKPLMKAIRELRGPAPTILSELENRFLALIREAGLPEPSANVLVEGYLVDFFWPRERLVVEVDGWEFHKSRKRFAGDRERDTKLQLADCRVIRATAHRIDREANELVSDVVEMLRIGPGRGRDPGRRGASDP